MSVSSKLTAIADAIRAKTGGTDTLTLDAMAEAVAGIQTGASALRYEGTFTTSATCSATVSCGFKPDLVVIFTPPGNMSDYKDHETNLKFAFGEKKTNYTEYAHAEYVNGLYTGVAWATTEGFNINMMGYDLSWSKTQNIVQNKTFSYLAVKYK